MPQHQPQIPAGARAALMAAVAAGRVIRPGHCEWPGCGRPPGEPLWPHGCRGRYARVVVWLCPEHAAEHARALATG